MKPILALDFDGTVHSYSSGWKGPRVIPDPPVEGALEFVVTALDHFTVAIHSSRSGYWGGRSAMKHWFLHHLEALGMASDAPRWWFDRICRTAFADPWDEEVCWAANRVIWEIKWPLFKPPALVTLDDRAITFTGTWPTFAELKAFRPWTAKRPAELAMVRHG